MSVKVGVRVRPFNQRQTDLNCRLCIDMIGPTTRLFDADDPDKHRDFAFDYSFWSHDEFTPDERGYFVADGDKYSDQQYVFEKVGLDILANAWEGYHCCLFAYGQTGSGKSYSMVGYGANKGIVPISCEQIFRRIEANDNKDKQYQVNVSMLEIYNERVQDLLIPINKRAKEGYKIRQHKTLGIYVEGLSKHCVDTYSSIEKKMQEGGRNRSIAATEMNASSSRAHTIISIEFKQRQVIQGKKREKLSVIHLVDLAGSEKVGKTGATGDRLKEAAGINKSLSVLGLVISTLADKSMGKGKNIIVPYRDSCLTRILQNALGGNSKTLMICAISPANDNYEQTLSTLRYADQAKKIQNKAVINESETDKLIRTLKAEKDDLAEKVRKMQEMFAKFQQGMGLDPNMAKELMQAREEIRYNEQVMNDMTMTKTQKLQNEQKQFGSAEKIDKSKPHLSNLNEDPQLSRRINYCIDIEETKIGKRGAQPTNDIEIGGMGMRAQHAVIIKQVVSEQETNDKQQNTENIEPKEGQEGKVQQENGEATETEEEEGEVKQTKAADTESTVSRFYVLPIMNNGQDSDVYLNGDAVTEKTEIFNLDRIAFGANHMFVIILPQTSPREQIEEYKLDWDYAQNELYLKKETIEKELVSEKERKIKEQTEAVLKQKEQQLENLQKRLKESDQARKNIEAKKEIEQMQLEKKIREEQAQRLRSQIENNKKKIQDSETQQKQKIKEKYYFQKKLLKTLPKCIQLNLIAKEFKRNISMSVKMMLLDAQADDGEIDMKKRSIKIKVVNRQVGYTYWWNVEKLSNRYYIIKDMSENYFQTGVIPTLDQKDDPFWDPPEHSLIGRGFLTTKALAYMFDNPVTLPIIGQDDHCGELVANLVPTNQTGDVNLCEQMDDQVQFQPEQLLEKPFYFNLIIEQAKIPANYENIYVEYSLKTTEFKIDTFKTNEVTEKTQTPKFDYVKLHSFQCVTESILKYLSTAKLIFKVYGHQIIPEEKKQVQQKTSSGQKKTQDSDVVKAKKQAQRAGVTGGSGSGKKSSIISQPKTSTQKAGTVNSGPSVKKATTTAGNTIPKRGKDDKDCVIY